MALRVFQGTASIVIPSNANKLGLNDYGTGDGDNQDYTLTNNTYTELGNLSQGGDTDFYSKLNGTLTGSGSTAHTSTKPANGEKLVFPNASAGVLRADDQSPYAQSAYKLYAVGDIDDIADYKYVASPGNDGIELSFVNQITETTIAMPSWYQFAPLNVADMSVGTYGSAGDPFQLDNDLLGYSTLASGASATATSVTMDDDADFYAGQFVKIGSGATVDICWVTDVTSNVLTLLQPLTYNHSPAETVYACSGACAIKVNIPTGISGGQSIDWVNLSLDVTSQKLVRI